MKYTKKHKMLRIIFYLLIFIIVIIQIYPIFWVVCSSFKTPEEMTYTAQYSIPSGFYMGNYISALTISNIPRYFLNSVIVGSLYSYWNCFVRLPGSFCYQQGESFLCQRTSGIFSFWNDDSCFCMSDSYVSDI